MIRTDSPRSQVRVSPPPEIDVASGDRLTEAIARACALGPAVIVVVDFSGVTFCDSTAVRVLVHSLRRLHDHGCAMDIRNPSRRFRQIATILDAAECLRVEPLALVPSRSQAGPSSPCAAPHTTPPTPAHPAARTVHDRQGSTGTGASPSSRSVTESGR